LDGRLLDAAHTMSLQFVSRGYTQYHTARNGVKSFLLRM
jgi:hypothetical protein